ncbi:hypothetical protein ARMSODRAFT_983340 [Armillaria solidipes]|uniref:Uncharacterized protein n=1 Tax=Armillaria solidipes TaxID=1076256 RepID=A0A2H3AQL1_9AGAR|nr:hypothetical protein ARMSODRAFT_983340 [Armillaria solidipes]
MAAIIILLYVTTTINSSLTWALIRSVLAETPYNIFLSGRPWISNIEVGTAAAVIADSIMVFGVVGWSGDDVGSCLISGFVFKILEIIAGVILEFESVDLLVIYISCILATTVWCTVLIVFRIVTVARANNGTNSTELGYYRHVIEVLVESSALHSVTLIVYAALEARGNLSRDYFDTLAVITTVDIELIFSEYISDENCMQGIAPTLLAGRVAAGHARPDDSWQGNIISSLRFEAHPQVDAETCSQENSIVDNADLEALSIQVDEETGAGERIKWV